MDDPQLINLLKHNDSLAFRELVEKYQSLVVKTCFNIIRKQEDAEDIAQDVFVEVYQSINQFRLEARLSTWLYRISVNKSLNFVRKNKWKNLLSSIDNFISGEKDRQRDIHDLSAENAPETIEYQERSKILQTAIDGLTKNQRIAFMLSKYDDLSYQEISEIMDLSLSSVESLIHRAKLNLQKKLIYYYKA